MSQEISGLKTAVLRHVWSRDASLETKEVSRHMVKVSHYVT